MENRFLIALLLIAIISISGCASSPAQTSATTQQATAVEQPHPERITLEKISDSPLTYKIVDTSASISAKQFLPQINEVASALFPNHCLGYVNSISILKDSEKKLTGKTLSWLYYFSSGPMKNQFEINVQKFNSKSFVLLSDPADYYTLKVTNNTLNPEPCMNFENYKDSTEAAAKASTSSAYDSSKDSYTSDAIDNRWRFLAYDVGARKYVVNITINALTGEFAS